MNKCLQCILKLKNYECMTAKEIASAINFNATTVRKIMAENKLRYKDGRGRDETIKSKIESQLHNGTKLSVYELSKKIKISVTKIEETLIHMYNVAEEDDGKCFLVR